jgi:hypothetical protein
MLPTDQQTMPRQAMTTVSAAVLQALTWRHWTARGGPRLCTRLLRIGTT